MLSSKTKTRYNIKTINKSSQYKYDVLHYNFIITRFTRNHIQIYLKTKNHYSSVSVRVLKRLVSVFDKRLASCFIEFISSSKAEF